MLSPANAFIAWMVFLSVLFCVFTGVFLSVISDPEKQDRLFNFTLTILFGYAYLRLLLLVGTDKVLKFSSPTYRDMPQSLQRDCAFMCSDAPSILMWVTLTGYLVVVIFIEQDIEAVRVRIGQAIYVGSAAYQLDRFMQVFNDFRWDRFIHHSLTCLWMLVVLEWVPIEYSDFSFLTLAFANDIIGGKVAWTWAFVARFARRHARSTKSWAFNDESGADQIIIPKSANCMAFVGKIVFGVVVFVDLILALSLLSTYAYLYQDETTMFWKIFPFGMLAVFILVDNPRNVLLFNYSKESYWTELLKKEEPKEKPKKKKSKKKDKATKNTEGKKKRKKEKNDATPDRSVSNHTTATSISEDSDWLDASDKV